MPPGVDASVDRWEGLAEFKEKEEEREETEEGGEEPSEEEGEEGALSACSDPPHIRHAARRPT